ncbi:MAG: hypothetical protein N4A45_00745 [Flavobacteriales bacterium]|jgi:hypothetical protein|nr:hypothetical protein [Flavobacteriales bacterium]
MKLALNSFFVLIFFVSNSFAQVGIGTISPNPSAILDVTSTNKGFLPPRLSFAELTAIQNPAEGLMVYCKDCCTSEGTISFFNGDIWNSLKFDGCTLIDLDNDGIPNAIDQDIDGDGILNIHDNVTVSLPSNPGFENLDNGASFPSAGGWTHVNQANVPYWSTTNTQGKIELAAAGFASTQPYEGNYFAELNANQFASLYQDVAVIENYHVNWSIAHKGRETPWGAPRTDAMIIKIGPIGNLTAVDTVFTHSSAWKVYSGSYSVPSGVTQIRFEFAAYIGYGSSYGNFIDAFTLELEAKDIDGDGLENQMDLDSDNDGIPDNVEYQTSSNYIAPGTQSDAQGRLQAYGNNGLTNPTDSDGDNLLDFLDADSDNDGQTDIQESGFTFSNSDKDNDGLHDNADATPNSGYQDVNGKAVNNSGNNMLPDANNGTDNEDYRE